MRTRPGCHPYRWFTLILTPSPVELSTATTASDLQVYNSARVIHNLAPVSCVLAALSATVPHMFDTSVPEGHRPPARGRLHAFIDESGQRSRSAASSDNFIMSAVVIPEERLADATTLLELVRADLKRHPGHALHWKNIKSHTHRLRACQLLAEADWLTISSVVVCKRQLGGDPLNDDLAYLFTLRYLLERLSWLARDQQRELAYTMAHVVRFQISKLREHEARWRDKPGSQIAWDHLDDRGGRLDQPSRIEHLQLADLAASATGAAFNKDEFGNTEIRYLQELAARLYRRNGKLLSYGLKLHPGRESTKAAYPWVAAL